MRNEEEGRFMAEEKKDIDDVPESDSDASSSSVNEPEETPASSDASPDAEESPENASSLEPSPAPLSDEFRAKEALNNIDRILDINLELVVQIGTLKMRLKDVLDLYPGSILEIEKNADAPLDLSIGTKKLAKGEVVTVGENLGLRIIKK
jgi:flagellar motor switch protein FliN/FliY